MALARAWWTPASILFIILHLTSIVFAVSITVSSTVTPYTNTPFPILWNSGPGNSGPGRYALRALRIRAPGVEETVPLFGSEFDIIVGGPMSGEVAVQLLRPGYYRFQVFNTRAPVRPVFTTNAVFTVLLPNGDQGTPEADEDVPLPLPTQTAPDNASTPVLPSPTDSELAETEDNTSLSTPTTTSAQARQTTFPIDTRQASFTVSQTDTGTSGSLDTAVEGTISESTSSGAPPVATNQPVGAESSSKSTPTAAIAGGVAGGAVFILLIIAAFIMQQRRRKNMPVTFNRDMMVRTPGMGAHDSPTLAPGHGQEHGYNAPSISSSAGRGRYGNEKETYLIE